MVTVNESVAVRETLLESPVFGIDEIERISTAIVGDQCQDVIRTLSELQQRTTPGDSSQRDVLAVGVTCYLLARHDAAIVFLSTLPGNGIAEYYHGLALLASDRYEESIEAFRAAGSHGYDPTQATLISASPIRLQGHLDEAEKVLRSTASEGARRAEYSYQMGCILADRGDTYGAIEYFERAVDMDPSHSAALFRLGNQNSSRGNDDEAVKLYERALAKPPIFLGALMNLGILYEDRENYQAAAFCFRRILQARPDHARASLFLKDIEASTDMYYDEEAARQSREMEQLLKTPVTDFELSARSRNCLEQAGIRTLGDLTRVTERDLLAGKNFGETSLKEISVILESRGLSLGESLHSPAEVVYQPPADLSPEERALHETPVAEMDLSVRSRKCLSKLGITTAGEMVTKSADELLSIRNFGVTSLNEIRAELTRIGLSLRNE